MRYLRVINFERFQHYKDRNPPWIKLYNSLLDDYEFACLQDASKLHLIMIWLLASRTDNKVPADPKWLSARMNATESVNLEPLVSAGFISIYQDASNMLASCPVSAMPETETETKGETETDDVSSDTSCPAPLESPKGCETPPPEQTVLADPVFLTFPTRGKTKTWHCTEGIVSQYESLYGDKVDVRFEIKRALQYVMDNPTEKKTAGKGMKCYLTAWLNRRVDRSGQFPTNGRSYKEPKRDLAVQGHVSDENPFMQKARTS